MIINVVAYGYHSIGQTDYQNLPSYQQGATPKEFIDAYIKDRRRLEIDLLDQLIPHLSVASKRKIVMMTLVTKQDLWWQNRHLIKDYYQAGTYNESIKKIQNTLGQANFIHEYISASLLTENFSAGNGEILASVAEGYDQRIQLVNFDRVLQFIENNLEVEMR